MANCEGCRLTCNPENALVVVKGEQFVAKMPCGEVRAEVDEDAQRAYVRQEQGKPVVVTPGALV